MLNSKPESIDLPTPVSSDLSAKPDDGEPDDQTMDISEHQQEEDDDDDDDDVEPICNTQLVPYQAKPPPMQKIAPEQLANAIALANASSSLWQRKIDCVSQELKKSRLNQSFEPTFCKQNFASDHDEMIIAISSDDDSYDYDDFKNSSTASRRTTKTTTTVKTEIKIEVKEEKDGSIILISLDDEEQEDNDRFFHRSTQQQQQESIDIKKEEKHDPSIWMDKITRSSSTLSEPQATRVTSSATTSDLLHLINNFVVNLQQTSIVCMPENANPTDFNQKRMDKYFKEIRRILKKVFGELSACNAGLRYYDGNSNPPSLHHVNRLTVKSWFAEKFPTTIPGTLRSYVCIFKKFLRYILAEETDATRDAEIVSHIRSCVEYLETSVGPSLSKSARCRKFNLQPQERKSLLTKEDMQSYENSLHVREITVRLSKLAELMQSKGPRYGGCLKPNITFCTEARNVLLTLLVFRSAQRSGCLAGLTLGEFAAATVESIATDPVALMVISVSNHKTYDVHGHAKLVVEKWLYDLMEIYAKYLRPLSNNFDTLKMNGDTAPFFITRSSTPLDNGYVSQAIVASWRMADIPSHFISVTNFRKVSTHTLSFDLTKLIDHY